MRGGFRQFLLRGNVNDLVVGVTIGAAFGGIVDSLVKDIISPLLGLLGGEPDGSAVQPGPPVPSPSEHDLQERRDLLARRQG